MTDEEATGVGSGAVGTAVVRKERPSIVWIIPIIALLVGAFVAWRVLSSRGPEITISFQTAEGIEAGKTQVKYRNVSVGLVEEITIAQDLTHVICRVRMAAGADEYLRDKTRFWIVKPRVAAGQVSGSGHIAVGLLHCRRPGGARQETEELRRPRGATHRRPGGSRPLFRAAVHARRFDGRRLAHLLSQVPRGPGSFLPSWATRTSSPRGCSSVRPMTPG